MSEPVRIPCPAKVNLFLRVLAREETGFHGIETVLCLIDLADELTATRRDEPGITLETGATDLGPAEENLAVRAADMVLEATGRKFGVTLGLRKRIPVQAGLGGGSSDAAAALALVNRLAGNVIPRHELLQFGARLGSDVPFFVAGGSLALAWGHGERMFRLPSLPRAPALLVVPPVRVPTGAAYQWVDQARATGKSRGSVVLDREALSSWGSIGRMAGNEFESVVFGHHPPVREAFEALVATHPLVCRMTGSGSTLFAVYRSERDRDDAKMMLPPRLGERIPVETA